VAAAERAGLGAALDTRLLTWFEASQLSALSLRLVQRLALTQGCGTPRALLTNNRVWDALGRAVARTVLDDLGEWLAAEGAASGFPAEKVDEAVAAARDEEPPPAPLERPAPRAGELAPGSTVAVLTAWAAARGVVRDLEQSALVLDDRVIGRARSWFWRNPGATVAQVITATPSRSPGAVPEEIQEAAIEWLADRARRAARALLDEQALVGRLSPPGAPLDTLWSDVLRARAALRETVGAIPADESVRARLILEEDPPAWTVSDGHPAWCAPGARAVVLLQPPAGQPLVRCTCGAACALGLVAVDTLLAVLGHPDHPQHTWLLTTLGTPRWQRALAAFDQALAPPPGEEATLGWRVDPDRRLVTPLACRPKKRGEGWTTAKLTRAELLSRPGLCALPGDRAARDLWVADASEGAWPALVALLVAHPRVYLGDTTIPVRRSPVGADWGVADDGGVSVTLRLGERPIPARALSAALGPVGPAVFASPDGLDVFEVDDGAAAFVQAIARWGGAFPADAAPALLARLAPLSRVVPARVAPALRGLARPPDERPLLRIDGLSDGGLLVRALVRPLAGGPAFPPGEGPDELHAGAGDTRVHVARALAAEPATVRAALATLPLLASAEAPPFTWTLAGDDALDLLSALDGWAGAVEWAGRPRRARAVAAGALSLRVASARDWLEVDGAVEVDGASLALGAVLAAVLAGRRYVAVDENTWAKLGDELVEKLGAVAEAATASDTGTELPKLAAGVLAELAAAGARLDAPAGWDALVSRAREVEGWDPPIPEGLQAELRDYQRAGFAWLARLARWAPGACLADDMGLGKTLQALALLVDRAPLGPALVIAPTSVGFNWLRESARFAPGLRAVALRGPGRREIPARAGPGDLLVTSWDLLPRDIDVLGEVRFSTVVLDEAQAMKNPSTARAKAAAKLRADFRLALTGTPVENRVAELWSLFRVVAPGLLGSWERFRGRFAVAIERDRDARRRAALARLIRPFLLRRLKGDVARELPPRSDHRVDVALSREERQLYDGARAAFAAELAAAGPADRFKVLAALTRLRQLACHPRLVDPASPLGSSKLARLVELVAELRAAGHRALVFSQFTRQLALVREAFEREGVPMRYLDGETPEVKRRAEVDAFQRGEGDVFLLSLKAAGTGLTLTAATYVIHLDPWWNPAVEDQASDRAHRIGQTQPVTVYRLVATGTIEEKILALHGEKRALVEGLLEGTGEAGALSTDELVALLTAPDEPPVDDLDAPVDDGGADESSRA
jgi:superfamily II DNA or RNA helicase